MRDVPDEAYFDGRIAAKAIQSLKKLKKGKGFDLEDLRDQFAQMENMGGLASLVDKLPGMGAGAAQAMQNPAHTKQMKRMVAIIDSMTPQERRRPELINGSRKRRVAQGSGTQIQDVNRLLKQHKQMQKMMKKMGSKGGMANMMRGLKGNLPPDDGKVTYQENDPATAIDEDQTIVVADPAPNTFDGGTLTVAISAGGVAAEDVLSIQPGGNVAVKLQCI